MLHPKLFYTEEPGFKMMDAGSKIIFYTQSETNT